MGSDLCTFDIEAYSYCRVDAPVYGSHGSFELTHCLGETAEPATRSNRCKSSATSDARLGINLELAFAKLRGGMEL
jgi:hypothetical protein